MFQAMLVLYMFIWPSANQGLSTYNTSSAALLSPKPKSWSFEEAGIFIRCDPGGLAPKILNLENSRCFCSWICVEWNDFFDMFSFLGRCFVAVLAMWEMCSRCAGAILIHSSSYPRYRYTETSFCKSDILKLFYSTYMYVYPSKDHGKMLCCQACCMPVIFVTVEEVSEL